MLLKLPGPLIESSGLLHEISSGKTYEPRLVCGAHEIVGRRFPGDNKAESFIEVACRIDFQDLQSDRYVLTRSLCQDCFDDLRSQAMPLLLRQDSKISEKQCVDTTLHRENARISPI